MKILFDREYGYIFWHDQDYDPSYDSLYPNNIVVYREWLLRSQLHLLIYMKRPFGTINPANISHIQPSQL